MSTPTRIWIAFDQQTWYTHPRISKLQNWLQSPKKQSRRVYSVYSALIGPTSRTKVMNNSKDFKPTCASLWSLILNFRSGNFLGRLFKDQNFWSRRSSLTTKQLANFRVCESVLLFEKCSSFKNALIVFQKPYPWHLQQAQFTFCGFRWKTAANHRYHREILRASLIYRSNDNDNDQATKVTLERSSQTT